MVGGTREKGPLAAGWFAVVLPHALVGCRDVGCTQGDGGVAGDSAVDDGWLLALSSRWVHMGGGVRRYARRAPGAT